MENEKCPFCGCSAIYEIERNDDLIGAYPQLFCNGCKMVFESENNSPHLKDKETYDYLREKTWRTWNTRTLPENTIQLPCKVGDEVWCVRDTKVYQKPVKGTVTEIYFRGNMDMCIVVRRLCRGRWGERVFATEQEAQAAIDRRMNDEKNL